MKALYGISEFNAEAARWFNDWIKIPPKCDQILSRI